MAATPIAVHMPDGLYPEVAFLQPMGTGQVAPDAGGYVVSPASAIPWEYEFTVPEACVGIYRVLLVDGDGLSVGDSFINLADSAVRQYTVGSYGDVLSLVDTAALLANLSSNYGTLNGQNASIIAKQLTIEGKVNGVIKSGEMFKVTSAYEADRNVIFTRI